MVEAFGEGARRNISSQEAVIEVQEAKRSPVFGAAFALARFIGAMVYDVGVHDPVVFTAVPVVLALVALPISH